MSNDNSQKETKTKLVTKTRMSTLVILLLGIVGIVGFIGLSSAFLKAPKRILIIEPEPVVLPIAMQISDISLFDISIDPSNLGNYFIPIIELGNFDNDGNAYNVLYTFGEFGLSTDGITMETTIPLEVHIDSSNHPAMQIALRTSSYSSSVGLVPSANAQVTIDDLNTICIPEGSGINNLTFKRPLISTASAQVNINSNTNPNSIDVVYYVDEDGNVYSDSSLINRLNETPCQLLTSNSFAPDNITSVTSENVFSDSFLMFYKSWNITFGQFYGSTFIQYGNNYDVVNSKLPLYIMSMNWGGSITAVPESTLTIDDTQSLCLPDHVLKSDEFKVFFYDKNGKPFSDMMLSQQIACGDTEPENQCTKVNCKKFPTHACCVVVQVEDDVEAL
ncbi:hypothetical protein IID19_04025 [Patescibacteria group bacterium]|nr:hypothetical protein [Patescibacteria group bacterium]